MRRYIASIGSVVPHLDAANLNNINAYFAISLSNPNFYGKRLGAQLKYLSENFKTIMIITSGYLYRHHYKIIYNCDEDAAIQRALLEEEKYITNELSNYNDLIKKDKFLFSTWKDIYFTEEFQASLQKIEKFSQTSIKFNERMHATAINFLEKKYINVNDSNIKRCLDFFLEETAMFDYLIAKSFLIQIYPGAMPQIFADIADNEFHDAPETLKSRINVALKLKKTSRKPQKRAKVIA